MTAPRSRVVVLISGRGSNMATLIEATADPAFPAEVVGVISNRADAAGLDIAARFGIPVRVIDREAHPGVGAQDAALERALVDLGAEIVCLAGYMRLLGAGLVERWAGRILNIHPSLLPLFKGLDTHSRALDAGVMVHGCTVHFVDAQMDGGPIVAQAVVPVMPGDSVGSLSARVLRAEHRLYPTALRLVAEGRARVENGRTVFSGVAANPATEARLVAPDLTAEGIDIESLARMTP